MLGHEAISRRLGLSRRDGFSALPLDGDCANGGSVSGYCPGHVEGYRHFVIIKGYSPSEVLVGRILRVVESGITRFRVLNNTGMARR